VFQWRTAVARGRVRRGSRKAFIAKQKVVGVLPCARRQPSSSMAAAWPEYGERGGGVATCGMYAGAWLVGRRGVACVDVWRTRGERERRWHDGSPTHGPADQGLASACGSSRPWCSGSDTDAGAHALECQASTRLSLALFRRVFLNFSQ
jgi:hypothetical protein